MKRLILFRHAKSSWRDEALADHQRPLSPRGERDGPRMAQAIAAQGFRRGVILSSTAVRARQTADMLRAAVGSDVSLVHDDRLYLASPGTILDVVAEQTADVVAVVGHNPGLTSLSRLLAPSLPLTNLPTAGIVAVDLSIDRWADAAGTTGALAFFDYPKRQSDRDGRGC